MAPDILRTLREQELRFHHPAPGSKPDDLEAMIAPGFREVGASGRRYDRAHALEALQRRLGDREPDRWRTRDFACLELGSSTWLLTYTLEQEARVTHRATIWRRTGHGWEALYHQGTPVREDA